MEGNTMIKLASLSLVLTACATEPTMLGPIDSPEPVDTVIGDTATDTIGDAPTDGAPMPDTVTCAYYLSDPLGGHVPACVSVPSGAMPTNGWPLVNAYHRTSGTSGEALSRAGLTTIATWAIVIQPDGNKNINTQYFDTGPECCDTAVHDPTHRVDLDWAEGLIHQEEALATIDTTQVYAVGLSNGGWMSEAIACDDPTDIVAAVSESASPPATCGAAIWLRTTRGTADGTRFYDDNSTSCPGGPPCKLNGNNNFTHYYSADDPSPYGCSGFTATGITKDYDASSGAPGAESTEYQANGCALTGTEIDFWSMAGSTHSPGWKTLWSTETTAWLHAHHR